MDSGSLIKLAFSKVTKGLWYLIHIPVYIYVTSAL